MDRQRRRNERRKLARGITSEVQNLEVAEEQLKKKKSLPGFIAKYRKEISFWLHHYMLLFCKLEDANIPFFKDMSREERNKWIQEYVDVSEFRTQLKEYLKEEEELKQESKK